MDVHVHGELKHYLLVLASVFSVMLSTTDKGVRKSGAQGSRCFKHGTNLKILVLVEVIHLTLIHVSSSATI